MSEFPFGLEKVKYLGDGAYVGVELGSAVIFTSNGETIMDKIYLDKYALWELYSWLISCGDE